jgi:hypothetical protein
LVPDSARIAGRRRPASAGKVDQCAEDRTAGRIGVGGDARERRYERSVDGAAPEARQHLRYDLRRDSGVDNGCVSDTFGRC